MSRTVKYLVVAGLVAVALYLVGLTVPGVAAIVLAAASGAMLRELVG